MRGARMRLHYAASILAAIGFLLPAPAAAADDLDESAAALSTSYPAGAIQSEEAADRALSDAKRARSQIEDRFVQEERCCQERFLANHCVDNAKERRRKSLAQVRPVETEANTFKRYARVTERDRALAEKNGARPPDGGGSPARPEAGPPDGREPKAGEAGADTRPNSDAGAGKVRKAEKRAADPTVDESDEARKREKNIEAYNRKVQKIEERQRKVEARKAEKAKKNQQEQRPPGQ